MGVKGLSFNILKKKFQFCEVGGLPIIHIRTLAKFGYRSERKVGNKKKKEYGDLKKNYLEILQLSAIFFQKYSTNGSHLFFFFFFPPFAMMRNFAT